MEKVEKLYVFARMQKDQDNTNTQSQALLDRAQGLVVEYDSAISFWCLKYYRYLRKNLTNT